MTQVPASGSGTPAAARARVLVIDDDPGVGKALRLMLEDEHDVTALTSPRQALTLLTSDPGFDIVFCDLMMAELSGLELHQALASARPGYEQRIVFMTGGAFGPNELRHEAQIKSTVIEKPFDMRRIQSLARGAMGRGGSRR